MNQKQARYNMVEQQIRPWDVLDLTVLEVIGKIPREHFVPNAYKSLAYADIEIPLAHNQSMLFPKIEGRILQELSIEISDTCLEVGTGSGFLTACMAHMGKSVYSIDIHEDFCQSAQARLADMHINNVTIEAMDGLNDSLSDQMYDVIAVTASMPVYDDRFESMLNNNGRLFVVSGVAPVMTASLIIRNGNCFDRITLFETNLKALVGTKLPVAFNL